jgi:iron(III) transport system substrate-binding protein
VRTGWRCPIHDPEAIFGNRSTESWDSGLAVSPLAVRRRERHINGVHDLRQTKAFLLLILGLGLLILIWQTVERGKLTVYCAHDAIFAEEILRAFEKKTRIPVVVKFDTEATKSLGLVEQIVREGKHPRADVFWNNELFGTLALAEHGLLEPYQGEGWKRIPPRFRDAEGRWTGFAARMRVTIRNTEAAPQPVTWPDSGDLSRWAIAKPLYGTTLTHYSLLWSQWGPARLKAWHAETRQRGVREVNGNAAVKDVVAAGTCVAGWTDTDDYFVARDAKAPVAAEPVRLENGATICIPNTVAILRNAKHGDHARKLVDFLLSAQTELALARSASRQVPLGPVEASDLPSDVRELVPAVAQAAPLTGLLPARNECLEWLKREYTQ